MAKVLLTPKEKECLDYIISYWSKRDESPLLREIADGMHISIARVQFYLDSLEKKKKISRSRGHRNIHVRSRA